MSKLRFLTRSIRTKQTALLISAAMVPLIVIIIIGLGQAKKLLNNKDFDHLEAIGTLKKDAVNQYFGNTFQIVSTFSNEQSVIEVVSELNHFIRETNENSAGQGYFNISDFQGILSDYQSNLKGLISNYEFSDLHLISSESGVVLYSFSNSENVGKSLLSAGLKQNPLSELYTGVINRRTTRITDFSIDPVSEKAVAFIGAPVLDEAGILVGVIAVEIDKTRIEEIMDEKAGLGESGETYLVGEDYLMRSNSRYSDESSFLKRKIETETVELGIRKTEGKKIIDGYHGTRVLSYFTPLELEKNFNADFDWVLLVEVNEREAFSAFKGLVIQMIIIASVMFVLIFIIARIFARFFTKPIFQLKEITNQIADGDLTKSTQIGQSDELGQLADSIEKMRESLRKQLEEMLEGANVISTSSAQLMTTVSQLASSSAETATSVSETTATVEEVKQTVEIANQKAVEVSDSAQKMAMVSQQGKSSVNDTINGMNNIKTQMESIAQIVVQMSEKGNTIGDIVANVNDLAEQSNLLAVNASIEAAKAGEHGKGFAVVAQEIKNLAERSKHATVQIRTILSEIQKEISSAVLATEQGSKAIDAGLIQSSNASEVIAALAASVEQSAQSNMQIAASSQQQFVGMDQIASAMENIKEASTQTVSSIKQSEESVADLKKLGERLLNMFKSYRLK